MARETRKRAIARVRSRLEYWTDRPHDPQQRSALRYYGDQPTTLSVRGSRPPAREPPPKPRLVDAIRAALQARAGT